MKIPHTIGHKSTAQHIEILLKSYHNYFAEPLLPGTDHDNAAALETLWNADFVVVSHGTEPDPVFNFGNPTALKLFELSFSDLTRLPSRKSAEAVSQAERDRLLAEVTEHGCIQNYTGVRVSSTGKKFFIENARVWNLYVESGAYYGQAAMFKSWKFV
ncbi:MEKHLA domain-containing protein [Spongorhabdus nitratireducens]